MQNGGVVELDDDIASRWGPRIVQLLEVGDAVQEQAAVRHAAHGGSVSWRRAASAAGPTSRRPLDRVGLAVLFVSVLIGLFAGAMRIPPIGILGWMVGDAAR